MRELIDAALDAITDVCQYPDTEAQETLDALNEIMAFVRQEVTTYEELVRMAEAGDE